MPSPTQNQGSQGETIAIDFLTQKGYRLLSRNYRYRRAEIDLIFSYQDKLLVFVEVKWRKDNGYDLPEETLSDTQIQNIFLAAEHYQEEQQWQGPIRFDIVALRKLPQQLEIIHFEDALI
ncbi:YraN family protein [Eisenibacter elegans]|jgi:putative endonuclease|uniref:YraN family protein n=1 Tax=Eisenibacter elegans TaxID=997 RepID=UPI00041E25FD|nr:YraN family protein [Eisenibacter elegans]